MWFVWKKGTTPPTFVHQTEEAAREEAERLARIHGGKFYVLCAVWAVEKTDVTWHKVDDLGEEIPF